MNQLIGDLKIKPSASDVEFLSKKAAIRTVAEAFRHALTADAACVCFRGATLVPRPPSCIHGDPLYDDRMLRVLLTMGDGLALDVRELVKQYKSTQPARGSEVRPSISEIAVNYYVDEGLTDPHPSKVCVFDDVITGGNHYKAIQSVIRRRFPEVAIVGLFVARRVPEEAARLIWRQKAGRREESSKSSGQLSEDDRRSAERRP